MGLGEVLFDCFPQREVLGGAPINLAVHANALLGRVGGQAVPATRVGNDDRGGRIRDALAARSIDTAYVQSDSQRSTGTVQVNLNDTGNASYVFAADTAWDAIDFSKQWQQLASSCQAVCFGTLAQRSDHSRGTIHQFLKLATSTLRLFDVNLRQQFYTAELVKESLNLATAMKLSDDELNVVCELLNVKTGSADDQAHTLAERFELDWLALTRGKLGTTLYSKGQKHVGEPVPAKPNPNADTVGAGDACCAGLAVGALLGWQPERALVLANTLGAYVASHSGATPELPNAILDLVSSDAV